MGLRKAIEYKNKFEEDMMRDMSGELDRVLSGPSLRIRNPRWEKGVLTVDLAFVNDLDGESTAKASLTKFALDDYFSDLKLPYAVSPLKPGGSKTVKVRFPGFSGRGGKLAKLKTEIETRDGQEFWSSLQYFDLAIPRRKDTSGR